MLEHSGTVTKINDGKIYVNIEVQSACSGCHAKSICTNIDKQTRQIIVPQKDDTININDVVVVQLEEKNGFNAIFLGYFLPFLLLVASLISSLMTLDVQWLAGLISVGILIPYYFILFLCRKRIDKQFQFTIKK
jgi:sigma-E factor negative regulatory protein RseC